MNPKRFSYLMIVFVVLLSAGTIAVAVTGDNLFKKQAAKLRHIKAQNQAIKEQEISLAQAKKDIENYQDLDSIARSVVPQDKDQAKTIREINNIADATGVQIQQISFDTSTLGQAAAKASTSSEGGSVQSSPPTNPGITQVKPVQGINGVYSLEITVSSGEKSSVSYYQFLKFLEKLEANRRTAHVTGITITPTERRGEISFSLKLNAYLKP